MKTFQMPGGFTKQVKAPAYQFRVEKPEEEQIGMIQGRRPDSKEEWWEALALIQLKIPFIYQLPILGGKRRRGGIVVDFLVQDPFDQPVEILGSYWHTGSMAVGDALKLLIERRYFHREVILIWDFQLKSRAMALDTNRRIFKR